MSFTSNYTLAQQRIIRISLAYIGAINIGHGLLEYTYFGAYPWPSTMAIAAGVVYACLACFLPRVQGWITLSSWATVLILTGVPFLVIRLWTLAGADSASVIWFMIFPVYAILFGDEPEETLFAALAALAGFIALNFLELMTPFWEYSAYPMVLAIPLSIYAIGAVALHMYLFARLKREADLETQYHLLALQHETKLAEVGRLAGHIAHEINTPISTLYFLIDRIRGKLNSDRQTEIPDDLNGLENVLKNMAETVRTLLKTTKKNSTNAIRALDMDTLRAELETLLAYRIRFSGIFIRWEYSELHGRKLDIQDGAAISQVLVILLNNSIDALSDTTSPDKKWIQILVSLTDESVHFSVIDGGPGIPPDIRSKIFEPDFSTKGSDKGNGFGLPVAREILRNLGGDIRLVETSKNTHFTMQIPYTKQTESITPRRNIG